MSPIPSFCQSWCSSPDSRLIRSMMSVSSMSNLRGCDCLRYAWTRFRALALTGQLRRAHLQRHGPFSPVDEYVQLSSDRILVREALEVVHALDLHPAHRQDQVARPDASPLGRTAGHY